MKRIAFTFIALILCTTLFAQNDTLKVPKSADTIRIGGMIIIKRGDGTGGRGRTITISRKKKKHSNISTAHWIIDLGFANYIDKTDYSSATSQSFIVNKPGSPALGENDFKLKTAKSSNVNIWVFMQRINLVKQYINLKYGIGIEMNNYRFKTPISFKEGGSNPYTSQNIPHPFVFKD